MFIKWRGRGEGSQNERTEKKVRNEIQIQASGYTSKTYNPKLLRFRSHLKQLNRKGENV